MAKDLADLIKKKLKDVKVVMTRYDDTFISLQERANIANRNRGDIFISIHTNSVDKSNPNRKSVQGTSVYARGLHKDQDNLKVARRENSVIELEENFDQKYSGFDPEVSMLSSPLTPGFDWGAYPKSRVFTMGLDIKF